MKAFFQQFGHPEGALGWLVGHLMALENGARSRWALELLAPRAGERVLEVGFGPGVDVRRLLAAVGAGGKVSGVDPSREMLRQARARNRSALANDRARLELGSAASLPFGAGAFDAVYAANSAQFWPDLAQAALEIQRVLAPGGRVLLVVQPMWRGATAEDSERWRQKLGAALEAARFREVTFARAELRPAPAVAVLGRRASA